MGITTDIPRLHSPFRGLAKTWVKEGDVLRQVALPAVEPFDVQPQEEKLSAEAVKRSLDKLKPGTGRGLAGLQMHGAKVHPGLLAERTKANPEFLEGVKEILEVGTGQRGDQLDRFLTLRDLSNEDVVAYLNKQPVSVTMSGPEQGVEQGKEKPPEPPYNLVKVSTDDPDRKAAFANHLTWDLPPDDDIVSTEVWVATTNNRAVAWQIGVVTYPQNEFVHSFYNPNNDYFYWIRCQDWAGLYSVWSSDQGDGLEFTSDTNVNEQVEKMIDALFGESPPTYSGGSTYYLGNRVQWQAGDGHVRTYKVINDSGGSGISGIPPSNTTYWERTGILAEGDVGGTPTVGIDGQLIVDGTIIADALIVNELSAITANVGTLTAGLIQSSNYNVPTDGFQIDLDNATLTVFEDGGLIFKEGSDLTFESSTLNYSFLTFKLGATPPRWTRIFGSNSVTDYGDFTIDNVGGPSTDTCFITGFNSLTGINQTYLLACIAGPTSQTYYNQVGSQQNGSFDLRCDTGALGGTPAHTWVAGFNMRANDIFGYSEINIYGTQGTGNPGIEYFGPGGLGEDKVTDLGRATFAWDTAYADDFTNVADFYFMDERRNKEGILVPVNDVEVIKSIRPSNKIDERTGFRLINDSTLPTWLVSKYKKDQTIRDIESDEIIAHYKKGDVHVNSEGKPYLSTKTMLSLLMGAVRQLDARIEKLEG